MAQPDIAAGVHAAVNEGYIDFDVAQTWGIIAAEQANSEA